MKINFSHLLLFIFFVISCNQTIDESKNNPVLKQEKDITANTSTSKLLRHVVLFKFNAAATPIIVEKIESAFAELPNKISEIQSFEWGINNSPEGLNKGLTHCFLVTFSSEADREIYLPHPAHQEFVKFIGPYVEDVTVVDYWKD